MAGGAFQYSPLRCLLSTSCTGADQSQPDLDGFRRSLAYVRAVILGGEYLLEGHATRTLTIPSFGPGSAAGPDSKYLCDMFQFADQAAIVLRPNTTLLGNTGLFSDFQLSV